MSKYTEIRFSHLIRHCAPGSLTRDRFDQLVALMDTRYWCDRKGGGLHGVEMERVNCVRTVLGIEKQLRHLPVGEAQAIPAIRFPAWCRCDHCNRLYLRPWTTQQVDEPKCEDAACDGRPLLQLPWVLVHPNGYMDDIPWHWLAHKKDRQHCDEYGQLFMTLDKGQICLRCKACGAHNRFSETALHDANFFTGYTRMRQQPWLSERVPHHEMQDAKTNPVGIEVGDSRIHESRTVGALVIPPESRMVGNPVVAKLRKRPDTLRNLQKIAEKRPDLLKSRLKQLANELHSDVETVRQAYAQITSESAEIECGQGELQLLEYRALTTPIPDLREDEEFVTRHYDDELRAFRNGLPFQSRAWKIMALIDKIVAVRRLREILVHRGFTRPVGEKARLVPPDLHGQQDWLPAIELFGEGLFLAFGQNSLRAWARQDAVQRRADILQARADQLGLPLPTPRFLLMHSFAHLLIRELESLCGYPAASLKERIYAWDATEDNPAIAGVLIYTTSPDVSGTLGGLDELAEPHRLSPILEAVFNHAEWCALDPVCAEHQGQGPHLLNLAACHGCALIPDTACQHGNLMLDRILLKGDPEQGLKPWIDFAPRTAA